VFNVIAAPFTGLVALALAAERRLVAKADPKRKPRETGLVESFRTAFGPP
jgi:hypothetical protein